MNEIENYKTRKNGGLTIDDVINRSKEVIKEEGAKHFVILIQTDDGVIHRVGTELNLIELTGLLETAKLTEVLED